MKIEYFTKEQLKSMSKNELVRMYLKVTDLVNKSYADYEEVVHCKDCKHWGKDGYRNGCKYATYIMLENDYCSMAERKEE